jgi:Zn-dependent protease with chaperone function
MDGAELHVATDSRSLEVFGLGVSRLTRLIETIENRPLSVLSVVLMAVGVSIGSYIYGLPLLAKSLAPRIPIAVKREIGSQGLVFLDKVMFMPTSLSKEQQIRPKRLVEGLQAAVALPLEPNVMTRRMGHGDKEAANAMALLPNTIIATDKLVAALDDAELEAVLAHEMGHLYLDHGTQSLVRGSAVSIATLVLFGGDPGVFQAIAINLVDSKNSRDHEREADLFALDCLARKGGEPMALHKALRKISEGHEESGLSSYLASHPMTSERLHEIETYSIRREGANR